tara:strand:- start:2683 stop:3543 length:861 start_codon:yes stop_codon:yes gene_type:complete
MKRIVYSIYVDIPAPEHFGTSKNKNDTVEKATETVNAFKEHEARLISTKKDYAKKIGASFKMYTYDKKYIEWQQQFTKDFPEFTGYEIINFYKIHILYELAKVYDEILYLDFDAIPLTDESFFDAWDLSKGMCVLHNNSHVIRDLRVNHSVRSPSAKYYNCQAMLIDGGYNHANNVINTGIIGATKEQVEELDYFGGFRHIIEMMTALKSDAYAETGLYPKNILDMFMYDNETIFSYKLQVNNIKIQWLDAEWHYFFDRQGFIPKQTKIVHAICKDFNCVWRWLDA